MKTSIKVTLSTEDETDHHLLIGGCHSFRTMLQERRNSSVSERGCTTRSHLTLPLAPGSSGGSSVPNSVPSSPSIIQHPALLLLKVMSKITILKTEDESFFCLVLTVSSGAVYWKRFMQLEN